MTNVLFLNINDLHYSSVPFIWNCCEVELFFYLGLKVISHNLICKFLYSFYVKGPSKGSSRWLLAVLKEAEIHFVCFFVGNLYFLPGCSEDVCSSLKLKNVTRLSSSVSVVTKLMWIFFLL